MKMLVVVDYQKDFVDGALGFAGAEKLDAGIAEKILAYEKDGGFIVQTMDTHYPDYLSTREGKHLPVLHCIEGTDGWETFGKTAEAIARVRNSPRFHRINKATFPVHPAQMLDLMEKLPEDITEIEFVGLVSNICVISNICVFQGAFPLAQVLLDKDLTASFDAKAHQAVLEVMASLQVKFL